MWNLSPRATLLSGVKDFAELLNKQPYPNHILRHLYHVRNRSLYAAYRKVLKSEIEGYLKLNECAADFQHPELAPIWMIWLDGGKSAVPNGMQICINSVFRNKGSHPVHFLNFELCKELVDIPKPLIDMYEKKIIRPAHLTDFIRMALLERYGGIWLDCSILLTKEIPDYVLQIPFWSVKNICPFPSDPLVPFGREWQIYAMAGQPGSTFYTIFKRLYFETITRCGGIPEYFFSYYLAKFIRESVPSVKSSYALIPTNNELCEQFMPYAQQIYPIDDNLKINLVGDSTFLYKLSRHSVKNCLIDDLCSFLLDSAD
jgi:hypothetical protein